MRVGLFVKEFSVLSTFPFDLIPQHQTDIPCGKPPMLKRENKRKNGKTFGIVMW